MRVPVRGRGHLRRAIPAAVAASWTNVVPTRALAAKAATDWARFRHEADVRKEDIALQRFRARQRVHEAVDGKGESKANGEGESEADGKGESKANGEGESKADGKGESEADGKGEFKADGGTGEFKDEGLELHAPPHPMLRENQACGGAWRGGWVRVVHGHASHTSTPLVDHCVSRFLGAHCDL